jgi:chromate transporter
MVMKKVLSLFFSFFFISLFVLGGGYVIIAVADRIFSRRGEIKDGELLDNLAVFQMIPGIIAAHTAVYVGNKKMGLVGAIAALLGAISPSILIFTFISHVYSSLPIENVFFKIAFLCLKGVLVYFIANSILRSWKRAEKSLFFYSVSFISFVSVAIFEIPIYVILLTAIISGVFYQWFIERSKKVFSFSFVPFLLFLQYGCLCFGGGFALVPMYVQDFVGPSAPFLQLSETDFSNLLSLTQITPGPIGINGATFLGYRIAGMAGAVISSLALVLPGFVFSLITFNSLDRFKTSFFVKAVMNGTRGASLSLMAYALLIFVKTLVVDGVQIFNIGLRGV